MDTDILICYKKLFKIYLDACGPDGKVPGDKVKKIIDENFSELIKQNKNPDTIRRLLEKAKPYIENGCNKKEYAELICAAFIDFCNDFDILSQQ